jgi:DNA-binding NarL/FixJ family response regulator
MGSSTTFVGRDDELALVADALASPGSVVLVEGEAGVGKSRLVGEFLQTRAAGPRSVLFGVCPPFRDPFTLGPLVAALRATCSGVADLRLDGLAGALRPIFPEWRDDLPPLPEQMEDAKAERHRLFAAIIQLLRARGVTLLVVEDVHWADEATLELLLLVASQPQDRISLLLTYRSHEVAPESLLLRLASRVPSTARYARVVLRPFDVTATTALISSLLGGDPITSEFADYLQERTEGLPLAVEESVRLLRGRESLELRNGVWERRSDADLDVPPLVRDSVLERTRSLPADAQQILHAAAVCSDPVDVDTIISVGDLPTARARRAIAQAVASGLVEEGATGLLAFRHVLAAKAVYDALPVLERRSLHLRAGHALTTVSPQPVARLVWHFQRARDIGNWALYAELVAEIAIGAGDDSTGVALLIDLVNTAALPLRTRIRLAKRLAAVEVFRRSVNSSLIRNVVDCLRAVIATEGMPARDVAEIRSPLGRLLMQMADFEAGRAELEMAIPDLGHDPVESTRAMVYLGWPYGSTCHMSEHIEWLRRSEMTEPPTLGEVEKMTLRVDRMTSLLLLGEESGWRLAAEIPVAVRSVTEGLEAPRGPGNAGATALLWGRYDLAHYHLSTALALADAGRFERIHDPILAAAAHLDWFTGQWKGLAEKVAAIGSDDGERLPQLEAILVARLLEVVAGNVAVAEKRLTEMYAEVEAQRVPDLFVVVAAALGSLLLQQGRADEVLEMTERPMFEVTRKGAWVWAAEIAPIRVEAMVVLQRLEEARWLSTAFARGVDGVAAPAPAAAVQLCKALLAQARGDDPVVVARRFGDVATAWEGLPRPYDAALASERQADTLLEAGLRRDEALDLLVGVRQALVDLGAKADAERVVATLRRNGMDVRGVQHGGRRSYGDRLSPRELDVLKLVVQGCTNRAIAELLSLSPKTVARHLESARKKLDVTTRTALAVKATETGILPEDPPLGLPRLRNVAH